MNNISVKTRKPMKKNHEPKNPDGSRKDSGANRAFFYSWAYENKPIKYRYNELLKTYEYPIEFDKAINLYKSGYWRRNSQKYLPWDYEWTIEVIDGVRTLVMIENAYRLPAYYIKPSTINIK